jgi:hypothetical protein
VSSTPLGSLPLSDGAPDPPPAVPQVHTPLPIMPRAKAAAAGGDCLAGWGWDLLLGSIAAFYAVLAPYTKVEESFNVQVPVSVPFLFPPFLRTVPTFGRSILAASAKCSVLSALDWSLNPSAAAVLVKGWRAIRCSSSSEFPISSVLRMFCASSLIHSQLGILYAREAGLYFLRTHIVV